MTDIVDRATSLPSRSTLGFWLLRAGFTVAPILFGLDKYFNWMVEWPGYLAPWIDRLIPGSAQQLMYVVGAVEILGGLTVAVAPWLGGYVIATWLSGVVVNLVTYDPPLYYDIALRDLGLAFAAFTLGRLAQEHRSKQHE